MKRTLKYKLTALIVLILTITINAQSSYAKGSKINIKGIITEKENKATLPFATITIMTKDNKIISGTTSGENGEFQIITPDVGDYKVKISFIGFKDKIVEINATDKPIDLGKLELETDNETLSASIVTEKIPLIEQKIDKIVMNVSESVMAKTSNGYEVLKKAPGVSVDNDGNIKLNGQIVDIWIDGRPSRMNGSQLEALLSAIDGSTIDKIEIMQNPSSKFDAEGSGGIINIKTKKNFAQGLYGNLSVNYIFNPSINSYANFRGSININYKGKKTNTYLTYAPTYIKERTDFNNDTKYGENFNTQQITNSSLIYKPRYNMLKLGSDINIGKKNIIGFLIGTTIRNAPTESNGSITNTYLNNEKISTNKSNIKEPGKSNNLDLNLYSIHKFSESSDITFNLDYNYFDINNFVEQSNKYQFNNFNNLNYLNDTSIAFNSNANQYINIYSLKVDYKQPFFKKGILEAGAKWTTTTTNNNMIYRDSINGTFITDINKSSKFDYKESVAASYISISYQINKKWSIVTGLRGEYTYTNGNWKSADTVSKKNYLGLFPTIYLGYTPNENWRITSSYTRRISRPRFNQLNPFKQYIDANSCIMGDPNITPEYSDNYSLTVGYKSNLSTSILYAKAKDIIMQKPIFNQENGEKTLKFSNYGKIRLIGATFSINELPLVDKLMYLNFNILCGTYKSTDDSEPVENKFITQFNSSLTFLLPKDIKIETNFYYQSRIKYGYMNVLSINNLSLGVKKDIWNNKATISILANDLLKSNGPNISFNNETSKYYIKQNRNIQNFRIGFSYKFGKPQAQRHGNKRDNTSERASDKNTNNINL